MRRSLIVAIALLSLAGCSTPAEDASSMPTEVVTLQVFAAASLTEAFEAIATKFEATHPGTTVAFNFAGSSDLATQIVEGAPADVFASANEKQMEVIGDAAESPQVFASNTLTIAVPTGNPAGIEGIGAFAKGNARLVMCAPEVPCGAAIQALAEAQGVTLTPVSEESNVTDVLGKVASGEADAGIVYVTDIARAAGVESVALEGADATVNLYPISAIVHGSHLERAQAFVNFVLSAEGQAVLASYGFGSPTP